MQQISPDPIFKILSGHMAAKCLCVASELGLFEALGNGIHSLPEIAGQIKVPARPLRILMDATVAIGFLERDGDGYKNTPVTAAFLSGQNPMDLRPVLSLWDKVVYPQWATLEESIRSDKRTYGLPEFSEREHGLFNAGVSTLTAPSAHALAEQYDFGRHRRILDLAGGMGLFLTAAIQRHQELQGTLFEIAAAADEARKRLAGTSLASRISVVEGDLFEDGIPSGHDAVIVANVVHMFSQKTNLTLLKRIRRAVSAGTRLLLVDFWMDPTHTHPLFAALMAAKFHIFSGEGDVYSAEEMSQWLSVTEWRVLEHRHLVGDASLIVAEAA